MFEGLTERLGDVFDRLSGRGVLGEKDFIAKAKESATGEAVIRSIRPADQVVKIVYDGLVEMLGGEEPEGLKLALNPPSVILMAGLQGSGKTTTAAKLALRLTKMDRQKVLMASLDTRRPA